MRLLSIFKSADARLTRWWRQTSVLERLAIALLAVAGLLAVYVLMGAAVIYYLIHTGQFVD